MKKFDDLPDWNPGTLLQLSGSYWQTFALHAGVKLDLFTVLAEEPQGAKQVAARLGLDPRGASMLLNAMAAMKLLYKKGEHFEVSNAARRYLNRSGSHYLGHMILHHHHLAETWARMDEAVRSGRPLRSRVSQSEEKREAFLMGMFNIASQQAPDIAAQVDIGGRTRLLDLGGGPGTYAIHFCRHNPKLTCTVFDLATTRPFAEKTIKQYELSHRINFVEGDFTEDPIHGPFDVAWLSHVLHAESRESCEQIISKVVRALAPGGVILIHEFILDDSMDGPLFPALFSLNMLQGTEKGQSYSQHDLTAMLEKAKVSQIKRLSYCGPTQSGILQGRAPDPD